MCCVLEELKKSEMQEEEEADKAKNCVYFEFSSSLDLFYLNYKNVLKYFAKLIFTKFYKVCLQ